MVAAVVKWAVVVEARHLREPREVGAAVDHSLLDLEDHRVGLAVDGVVERDRAVDGARHERGLDAALDAVPVAAGYGCEVWGLGRDPIEPR